MMAMYRMPDHFFKGEDSLEGLSASYDPLWFLKGDLGAPEDSSFVPTWSPSLNAGSAPDDTMHPAVHMSAAQTPPDLLQSDDGSTYSSGWSGVTSPISTSSPHASTSTLQHPYLGMNLDPTAPNLPLAIGFQNALGGSALPMPFLDAADLNFLGLTEDVDGDRANYTGDPSPSTSTTLPAPAPIEYLSEESRWQAVSDRSRQADNRFVFCVTTTKIYCRPSCPSRRPLRTNIVFYDTCADACLAGFRACKRCTPDEDTGLAETRQRQAVEDAQKIISEAIAGGKRVPRLEDLAKGVGMSKCYFQKMFKKRVGVTADQYGKACETLMNSGAQ